MAAVISCGCIVCSLKSLPLVVRVTDFSAEDKASGVKFCSAVHRRPRQGITHFGELCSPRSPKSDESASARVRRPQGSDCERCEGAACVDIGQSPLTYLLTLWNSESVT